MKFKISKSLKAGKLYFIARSRVGTIRRDTVEEIEKAIEEYNKRIESGKIEVVNLDEEEVGGSRAEEPETEAKEQKELKSEARAEEKKSTVSLKKNRTAGTKVKKTPLKFSGFTR